jgi:AraC-like DNA-binding protein
MPGILSRRDFASLLRLSAFLPFASTIGAVSFENNFRIRTITAGLQGQKAGAFDQAEAAITFLRKARVTFEAEGYEVQTLRLATQPLQEYLPDWRLLLSSPIGSITATDVARAIFVTKRTLQRRLEQEGTSYREITEKLYSELAARHLREPDLSIESVAVLLGYYDTAAFRKAFNRWYGQSPSDYRRSTYDTI